MPILREDAFPLMPAAEAPAVVNLRDDPRRQDVHYIGRAFAGRPASVFGNPVRIAADTPEARLSAVAEFAHGFTREYPARLEIGDLADGGDLACWCAPSLCHGHVISLVIPILRLTGSPCPRCGTPARSWINRHIDTLYEFARCSRCQAYTIHDRGSFTEQILQPLSLPSCPESPSIPPGKLK